MALDTPCIAKERAQIAPPPQREFGQKNQVCPIRVWLAKGYPWLRRHCASSLDMASPGLTTLGMRCVLLRSGSMSVLSVGQAYFVDDTPLQSIPSCAYFLRSSSWWLDCVGASPAIDEDL